MSHANEHQAADHAPANPAVKTLPGKALNQAHDPWPLWEVFVRHRQGLEHKHCGSLRAADAQQALNMARDVYTRRQEGVSIWIVPSHAITASTAEHSDAFFDPMADKIYRHPSFYRLPEAVDHM